MPVNAFCISYSKVGLLKFIRISFCQVVLRTFLSGHLCSPCALFCRPKTVISGHQSLREHAKQRQGFKRMGYSFVSVCYCWVTLLSVCYLLHFRYRLVLMTSYLANYTASRSTYCVSCWTSWHLCVIDFLLGMNSKAGLSAKKTDLSLVLSNKFLRHFPDNYSEWINLAVLFWGT